MKELKNKQETTSNVSNNNILNYLLYKNNLIKLSIVSIVLSILISLTIDENIINYLKDMFFIFLSLLLFIRVEDDINDYEEDLKNETKKQYLNVKHLKRLSLFISFTFLVLNIINFGLWGISSVILLIYVILHNHIEILKLFLLSISAMYYIVLSKNFIVFKNIKVILLMMLFLVIPLMYSILKRRNK